MHTNIYEQGGWGLCGARASWVKNHFLQFFFVPTHRFDSWASIVLRLWANNPVWNLVPPSWLAFFFSTGQVKRNLKELYQLILKVQEERSKSEHNLSQISKTHEKMQVYFDPPASEFDSLAEFGLWSSRYASVTCLKSLLLRSGICTEWTKSHFVL